MLPRTIHYKKLYPMLSIHLPSQASVQMTIYQTDIAQHRNLFVVQSDWLLSSVVRLNEDVADRDTYERLNTIMNRHESAIKGSTIYSLNGK